MLRAGVYETRLVNWPAQGGPKVSRQRFMENSISAGERIAAVVQRLVSQRSITRAVTLDDSLAQAGLTSLDAVRLVLLVEDEFNIEIPVSELTLMNFRSISTISLLVTRLMSRT